MDRYFRCLGGIVLDDHDRRLLDARRLEGRHRTAVAPRVLQRGELVPVPVGQCAHQRLLRVVVEQREVLRTGIVDEHRVEEKLHMIEK